MLKKLSICKQNKKTTKKNNNKKIPENLWHRNENFWKKYLLSAIWSFLKFFFYSLFPPSNKDFKMSGSH